MMTGAVLILAGFTLVTAAVLTTAGIPSTAAVVALVGWLRSEALYRGTLHRLHAAALEIEAAEKARDDLQAKMDALPIVHLTLNGSGEESERTLH